MIMGRAAALLGQSGRNGHARPGAKARSAQADGGTRDARFPASGPATRLRQGRFPGGAGVDRPGAVFYPQVLGQVAGRHQAPERYLVLGLPR